MEKIVIPFGKVFKGTVIGPLKAAKDYSKAKINLKKYEKKYPDIIPLNKLKKKVYKSNEKFVDLSDEISNQLIQFLKNLSSNTTDVYFDDSNRPVLSCSYSVKQKLFNKNSMLICNCISPSAINNSSYYYIAACIKYNIITDNTESMLTSLISKI